MSRQIARTGTGCKGESRALLTAYRTETAHEAAFGSQHAGAAVPPHRAGHDGLDDALAAPASDQARLVPAPSALGAGPDTVA
jgi:hypothetical protein